MKRELLLITTFFVTILFAQFGSLQEITEDNRLNIENTNSFICKGDTIYTCFTEQGRTKFGISFNSGGTFEFTELFYYYDGFVYIGISNPELAVLSDNTIHVFGNTLEGFVMMTSSDFGESFTIELLEYSKKAKITQVQDDIYVITNNQPYNRNMIKSTPGQVETILNENRDENSYADYYNSINEKYLKQWNNFDKEVQPRTTVDDMFETAQQYGRRVVSDSSDIAYIELDGNTYHGYEGIIQFNGYDTLNVYSWYPANADQVQMAIDSNINWLEDSDIIAQNIIPNYETIWTEISGEIGNNDFFYVEGDLWIEGEVKGKHTWYANGQLRLLGDIYLSHTEVGDNPDGQYTIDDTLYYFSRPINGTDFIQMTTNNIAVIAYKHFHPESGVVINNNSDPTSGINIYASISCPRYGGNTNSDGHFTFEYQHPHGSTPDFIAPSPYTGNDTLYSYVDLHKFIMDYNDSMPSNIEGFAIHGNYPIDNSSCGFPYESEEYLNSLPNIDESYIFPYGTDYPWYNPVWPESLEDIVFERGINRFQGALLQAIRGFMHRSGTDSDNHQDNVWDIENYLYDGVHASTGYCKEYKYDYRIPSFGAFNSLGHFSLESTYSIMKLSDGEWSNLYTSSMNNYLRSNEDETHMATNESNLLIVKKNHDFLNYINSNDNFNSFSSGEIPEFYNEIEDIKLQGSRSLILSNNYDTHSDKFQLFIHEFDMVELSLNEIYYEEIPYQQELVVAMEIDSNGNPILAYYIENVGIWFKYNFSETGFNSEYLWDADFADMPNNMDLIQTESGEFSVILIDGISHGSSKLQFASGLLDVTDTDEIELPKPSVTLSNHPNPFNPSTEIKFSAKNAKEAKIEIYNIKGQKIKTFSVISTEAINGGVERSHSSFNSAQDDRSDLSVIWNGTDQNNHPVSSGIYYYTLELDGKVTASRKMILLK